MANWSDIVIIGRIVRSLLKDRLNITGRDSYLYVGDSNFTLSEDFPDSTTVKVFKNGTQLLTGYSYNSSTNIVTITAPLTTNDIILITYSFFNKYSEAEITDYIEASLVYFSQFGYKKDFKLNDSRTEVLTINGINPNVRECYEIAIITAICIDPENIEIRTKDFTITAANHESKNELIQKSLMQFTVWYGDFDFVEGKLFGNSLDDLLDGPANC